MYQLRTLGTLDLRTVDGHPVHSVLSQPKRCALLCYLAVSCPHGLFRRDRIAALFWPESDDEHARSSLRQALHALRRSLGDDAVITRGADEMAISSAHVWCDVAELDRAWQAHRWADVVELHRGPLLDGFYLPDCEPFEVWLDEQRQRLRERAEAAAWHCVDDCVAARDVCGAVAWGQRALEFAHVADEAALRRYLELAASLGERAAGLQAYERFVQRLRREFELEPSPETEQLAHQLAAAEPVAPRAQPAVPAIEHATSPAETSELTAPVPPGPAPQAAGTGRARRRKVSWLGLSLAPLPILAAAVLWIGVPWQPAPPGIHAVVTTGIRLTDRLGQFLDADISPDGTLLAYANPGRQIVVRTISGDSSWVIPGSEQGGHPVFSPDSRELVYNRGNTLYRWPVRGVAPVEIGPMERTKPWWGEDDRLYFALQLDGTGIWRRSLDAGSEPEQLTRLRPGERAHVLPQLLPGARALLYTVLGMSGGARGSRVVAQRLGDERVHTLAENAVYGRYLPSGHLLYADDDGTLYARRFDPQRLVTLGKPAAVQVGVGMATQLGEAFVDFSDTGTQIYLERTSRPAYVFTVSDRQGREVPFPDSAAMALMGPVVFQGRISPDGERVVFTGMRPGSADLWLVTMQGEVERLTLDDAEDERAAWSPDGNAVAYTSSPSRIMVMDLGNASKPRLVRRWSSHVHVHSWSPDGRWLLIGDHPSSTRRDLWAVSLDGRDSIAVATGPDQEFDGEFSPDGRWVAYFSVLDGRPEVFVVSFPDPGIRRQVTTTGGVRPRWGRNGRELLYVANGKLLSRPVDTSRGLAIGPAAELFARRPFDYFDVTRDGQRILLRFANGNDTTDYPPLHLRTNWFDHIGDRVD